MNARRTTHTMPKPRPNYEQARRQTPSLFESPEDRANEAAYAQYICDKRGCKMFKLPIAWHLDYLVTNQAQHGLAWAEMKHRKVAHNAFTTFRLSALKFCRGIELSERFMNMQYLIFVHWIDNKKMYYKYDSAHRDKLQIVWGGRQSKEAFRQDSANDVEAMVEIPLDLFKDV